MSNSADTPQIADVFPEFLAFSNDHLFGEIWAREGLSPRDRSLITVALICANFRPDPLKHHLQLALANGVTKPELKEIMMHVAFYAGWPTAVSAMQASLAFFAEGDAKTGA